MMFDYIYLHFCQTYFQIIFLNVTGFIKCLYECLCVYLLHVESDLGGSQASVRKPQLVQVGHRLLSCIRLQRRQFLS